MESSQKNCPFCKQNVSNYTLHVAKCEREYLKRPQKSQPGTNVNSGSSQREPNKDDQGQNIFPESNSVRRDPPPMNQRITGVNQPVPQCIERPDSTMSYYHPLNIGQNIANEEIKCPNCGEKLTIESLASHVDTCAFKEECCQFCRQSFPNYLINEHLDICEEAISSLRQQQATRQGVRQRLNNPNNNEQINQHPNLQQQPDNQQAQQNTQGGRMQNPFAHIFGNQQMQQQRSGEEEEPPISQNVPTFEQQQRLNQRNGEGRRQVSFSLNPFGQMFQMIFLDPQGGERRVGNDQSGSDTANEQILIHVINQMVGHPQTNALQYLIRHGNLEGFDASNNGGLNPNQVKSFPVHEFEKKKEMNPDQCSCTICMSEFEEKEKVKILDCMHSYHVECIDAWLKKNTTCPVCKKDMREFV